MSLRTTGTAAIVAAFVTATGLLAYDRLVVKPGQVIGIVDVEQVVRAAQAAFDAGGGDAQRQRTQALDFAGRLERALAELPLECRCLVIERSAVLGGAANAVDLTAALRARLGIAS